MINQIKLLTAISVVTLLTACGGGGNDNSNEPFACSGVIFPSSGGSVIPVGGWCTPTVTSTVQTPQNSLSNCCYAITGTLVNNILERQEYRVQIGKSDLRGRVCTQERAYFSCQQ